MLIGVELAGARNSALHQSASTVDGTDGTGSTTGIEGAAGVAAAPRHTKVFTRDELPPQEFDDDDGYRPAPGTFAGIELDEFYWARQRAKRVLLFWVVAVITLAALAAAGAWTLGANLSNLL